jgi:hypothetical protein
MVCRATISALATVLLTAKACANCGLGSKTVFYCMTATGKAIEVCDAGKTIAYSFGKPRKPEIVVKVQRNHASTSQWAGIGRYIAYAVDIPNGNATYSVYWGVDRLADEHPIEAGVNILIDDKMAATVKCSGNTIKQDLEGIDLKPTG